MATITTIDASDLISDSRSDINTNFANLNSDKIETSTLDTDTALTANSDSKIPTQKAVKAYVDSGGNVNASETTKGIVEEATDAEVTAGTATGGTGAKLFVTPAKLATRMGSLLKFGGTGADGALAITSGATDIDLGGAAIVVKNYTSISITGTGSLTFSNPHASGTVIVLKSQGAVTLTSSTAPMIVASGLGASGGAGGSTAAATTVHGSTGTASTVNNITTNAGVGSATMAGGAIATSAFTPIMDSYLVKQKYSKLFLGPGGGGGAAKNTDSGTTNTVGGTGGRGGGCLVIECGGALNFTTSAGISVAGANGTAGVMGSGVNDGGAGGGGGGGGGLCLVLYNSVTANTGTITVTGGTGGNSDIAGSVNAEAFGGGGGGGVSAAGSNGTSQITAGVKSGGDGAVGYSLVALNTEFA